MSYSINVFIIVHHLISPYYQFQSITRGRATQQYTLTAIELAIRGEEDTLAAGKLIPRQRERIPRIISHHLLLSDRLINKTPEQPLFHRQPGGRDSRIATLRPTHDYRVEQHPPASQSTETLFYPSTPPTRLV